jgi:imidazolonepropionase-like amidohydrolase
MAMLLAATQIATGFLGAPPSEAPGTASETAAPASAGSEGAPGLALRARTLLTAAREGPQVVDNGVLLIRDGLVEAVGPAGSTPVPDGYELRDLGERWLMPGMIDLHCHIGGSFDINDMVFPTNPELKVRGSVRPDNASLRRAVAGGVTSVLYIPGSGTNSGGQGVLFKTGLERYEEALIRDPGSLKVAQWGNPEGWTIGVGKSFENYSLRAMFQRGMAYARRWEAYEAGQGERPERDIQWELFRDLAAGRTQVSTHTQVYQVVLATIMMIKVEFGVDVFIDHGSLGGWQAGALAAEHGVPAILGPREVDWPDGRMARWVGVAPERAQGSAAGYQSLGHEMIGFNTDSPVIPQEELFLQAGTSVRYGFDNSRLQAVRGLTIVPAMTAGIDHLVGSLEPGKEADVLIVSGDPADPRSAVDAVYIEGRLVYDTAQERRRF